MEAARAAQLHTWVASLPQGYDTMVGVGGRQLSVGQRQRLAIARALVRWVMSCPQMLSSSYVTPRSPRIMLLDEATSALDFDNERAVQVSSVLIYCLGIMTIQESLNTALMGRTGVMVTTAVTRAQSADTIFVLEGGRVVESGSHQELWDQRGLYWAMWKANNNLRWQH